MANMGSIASFVMSVTINEDDNEVESDQQKGIKLWGLVVCHHTSPRFFPFPLRYACEFLIQVFGVQINKEVELAAQLREKHILRTQTVLCDMLLRDAPVEAQIRDIAEWLLEYHNGSTGLSTDSLMEAGYPAASVLGDEVCGVIPVPRCKGNQVGWCKT
nr:phytochrome [Quercus suber]